MTEYAEQVGTAELIGRLRGDRLEIAKSMMIGDYEAVLSTATQAMDTVHELFQHEDENNALSAFIRMEQIGVQTDIIRAHISLGDGEEALYGAGALADQVMGLSEQAGSLEALAAFGGQVCWHGRYTPTGECISKPPCQ